MRRRKRIFVILIIIFFSVTFFYSTILDEVQGKASQGETATRRQNFSLQEQKLKQLIRSYNQSECDTYPDNISETFPNCLEKMKWMKNGWETHKCYGQNGVDGSICSFRFYLSKTESHCPPVLMVENRPKKDETPAEMSLEIDKLLKKLEGSPAYMKTRVTRLWSKWQEGAKQAEIDYPTAMKNRKKLNILVFIGFLSNEETLKLGQKSDHGGPLGELLQWSDLLASLSIIGHNVVLSTDKASLRRFVNSQVSNGPCEFSNGIRQQLDLIFTDIMGLNILKKVNRQFAAGNMCRVRLVDSFGTHAEFTMKPYFLTHKKELSGPYSSRNPWGGHRLDLRQHWTFFPHSHDNTFLGFVVDSDGKQKTRKVGNSEDRILKALVYGKEQYMWKEAEKPIRILKELTEVHATVANMDENTTLGVINHGFLGPDEISKLLDEVDIFFGFGFPLEGPAPLEAIAHGAIFINAKFKEPKSRKNYQFLAEKPTLRALTSQSPYMENIGEPHVITVDVENEQELRAAIQKVRQLKPFPKIPEEFTTKGMVLRVAQLVEKQDVCQKVAENKRWPPIAAIKILKSGPDESCEDACLKKYLMCEPSFFPDINKIQVLRREFAECATSSTIDSQAVPIAPFNCTIQSTSQLFSCASRPSSQFSVSRLCPCRDFIKEQHALCRDCL